MGIVPSRGDETVWPDWTSPLFAGLSTFGIASENVASSLDLLFASLWRLRGVLPQGTVVFGYPDTPAVVEVMRRYDALLLQPEFVRQIGDNTLSWQSFPNILPLHSVTTQEVITRNLSRPVLVERFARAARERSVRVLLLRPYDIASAPWIDSFEEDLLSEGFAPEGRL